MALAAQTKLASAASLTSSLSALTIWYCRLLTNLRDTWTFRRSVYGRIALYNGMWRHGRCRGVLTMASGMERRKTSTWTLLSWRPRDRTVAAKGFHRRSNIWVSTSRYRHYNALLGWPVKRVRSQAAQRSWQDRHHRPWHLSFKISDTLVVLCICFKSDRKAVYNFKFNSSWISVFNTKQSH